MAKRKSASENEGKIKFRVIEFELEGSDSALRDSLEAINYAMGRKKNVIVERQLLGATQENQESDDEPEFGDSDDQSDIDTDGISSEKKKRVRRATERAPHPIEVDVEDPEMPFSKFAAGFEPKSTADAYLMYGLWKKEYKQTDIISGLECYSLCHLMKWPKDNDTTQPLRYLKSKKKFVDKGEKKGTYRINQFGINHAKALKQRVST